MNRISSGIGVIATVAASSMLLFALTAGTASGAPSIGKNGVIFSCFKAKGKNKGALRVVAGKRSCRRMRGWRPLSWSVSGPSGTGQTGSPGARGARGPQGNPGPEGKEGQQGAASQVEQALIDTVQSQAAQIDALSAEVTGLSSEVLGLKGDLTALEGTVGDACDQLELVTTQADEILDSLLGTTVAVVGTLLDVPSPPDPLGPFECG